MKRYQQLFNKLTINNQGAFIPFVTLGDPNFNISLQIIITLIESGADAIELGIPFSDPLADGPTIQKANLRAFSSGMTFKKCFNIIKYIRLKYSSLPIGLLIYANLIYNNGIENFYSKCKYYDIDSVLVADVPIQESLPFRKFALYNNIAPIFICPPNADNDLLKKISIHSKAYTYLLSRTGVTGSEKRANLPINHLVNKLIKYKASPLIQGFGISEPNQIISALKAGVSGVISGSAIICIIEKYINNYNLMLENISLFVKKMKNSTNKFLTIKI